MGVTVPVYLDMASYDEPDRLLVKDHFFGQYTLENFDKLNLKILLNRDRTIHMEITE